MFWKKKRIFLDHASSTPIDGAVLDAMHEAERLAWANPSALYGEALKSKEMMQEGRKRAAAFLNCNKNNIIFTSGGTESNNIALRGIFDRFKKDNPEKIPHIITTEIEHPAILEVCKEIEMLGGRVSYLPVGESGCVESAVVKAALTDETILVSVQYVNNEIGTVQPIREIVTAVTHYREVHQTPFPYVHTDACQAVLHYSLDVSTLGVDLLSLDGIKMHGPRGVGLLFVRSDVRLDPVSFGGGQEKGIRSGTENVVAIAGFGVALERASCMRKAESERLSALRDTFISRMLETFPKATLNGSREHASPHIINFCFPGLDAEYAVIALDVLGIAVSYSSSCRMLSENSSSYVVASLGKPECASSSLRFSLGRDTTPADLDRLIEALKGIVGK